MGLEVQDVHLKINSITTCLVYMYIILKYFILHEKYNFLAEILLVSLTLPLMLFVLSKLRNDIRFYSGDLLRYVLIGLVYLLILLFSDYSVINTSTTFIFLFLITFYFYRDNISLDYEGLNKSIYFLMCLSLIVQLLSLKITGEWYSILGWDKNFTGVIFFLFFMFCYKHKYTFGILLAVVASLFLMSRAYIVALVLFFIFKALKSPIHKLLKTFLFRKMTRVLTCLLILIYFFSYFWVFSVASNGVASYQEGINDGSNLMRFAANVKVFELISENEHLFLYGYDNNLKEVLGIDSEDDSSHTIYYGARLVQTHNSLLSIIIKSGILFGILYLIVLSKIIDKYYIKENIEYIFPYLFISMIMHSLLNAGFLFFWILILHTPVRSKFKIFGMTLSKNSRLTTETKVA